ncbi:DNA-3-methyladenine glycosylase 2 [mine drainage metagenome]|uniref:DNA-3-methyladenine glycosylase 2 n=1 Tax=mine drainage metagenome TaxID=410659 RepID=A0A1J5PRS0_9ZZZZ
MRCRPELAPQGVQGGNPSYTSIWSTQDASSILATQAARLIDSPHNWSVQVPDANALAQRLGISDRHLRRIFATQFGVSPLQYLQTRRLLCAKQLLTDTALGVVQVARMSGFASVRRFNAAFVGSYGLNPTQLRRTGAVPGPRGNATAVQVKLSYRPPYDVQAMLAFLAKREITGTERVTLTSGHRGIARTLRISNGAQVYSGHLVARFDEPCYRVNLTVSDSLVDVLPQVMSGVRCLLDLDAEPSAINQVLQGYFPDTDGLRLPGALDGFELAVRAVLGQQITVAAARTLCQRLVERFGEPIATPIEGLDCLFPSAQALAAASGEALGQLGIVRQRQSAIGALARAVASGALALHAGADPAKTMTELLALPGIGDWTAQYITMRALAWPDAFPSGDVALQKALAVRDNPQPAQAALAASRAWQPWRSYAVIRAWARLPSGPKQTATPDQ